MGPSGKCYFRHWNRHSQIRCTIYDCLIDGKDPREALLKCEVENLFIIPSNIDLVGAEIEMLDRYERERRLKRCLKNRTGL